MRERAKILGVLNVTPDSFSDGGQYVDLDAALAHADEMVKSGADIIDVGGESTRPGAERVSPESERERVMPVITALTGRGIAVSVDTMNADTALAAVDAGASIINDVSGGLADRGMAKVIADTGVRYVVMHWRGPSNEMVSLAHYRDVPADVRHELTTRVAQLLAQGVREEQIVLDPGLGFAKDALHNWQLLARMSELRAIGFPVLIGASRKRFISALPTHRAATPEVDPRDLPTALVSALAAQSGAWGLRVHDVASTAVALDVVDAWASGRSR